MTSFSSSAFPIRDFFFRSVKGTEVTCLSECHYEFLFFSVFAGRYKDNKFY